MKDFNQAHIVKVKDLETREKILAGKEKQISEANQRVKQQLDSRLSQLQHQEQQASKLSLENSKK